MGRLRRWLRFRPWPTRSRGQCWFLYTGPERSAQRRKRKPASILGDTRKDRAGTLTRGRCLPAKRRSRSTGCARSGSRFAPTSTTPRGCSSFTLSMRSLVAARSRRREIRVRECRSSGGKGALFGRWRSTAGSRPMRRRARPSPATARGSQRSGFLPAARRDRSRPRRGIAAARCPIARRLASPGARYGRCAV
jgi:hypothetical protein